MIKILISDSKLISNDLGPFAKILEESERFKDYKNKN